MRTPTISFLVAALLALGAGLHRPAPAAACGNAVSRADGEAHHLSLAEGSTSVGKHRAALLYIARFMPEASKPGDRKLTDRGLLISALAIARAEGRFDRKGEEVPAEKVPTVLAWAKATVTALRDKKQDDPELTSAYAEVLIAEKGSDTEALALLAPLEDKGLLPTAHGYAALARARARAGERGPAWLSPATAALHRAPRAIDLARCEKMAADKTICAGVDPKVVAEKPAAYPPLEVKGAHPPRRVRL